MPLRTLNAKRRRAGEDIKIFYRLCGHVNPVKSLNIDDPRERLSLFLSRGTHVFATVSPNRN